MSLVKDTLTSAERDNRGTKGDAVKSRTPMYDRATPLLSHSCAMFPYSALLQRCYDFRPPRKTTAPPDKNKPPDTERPDIAFEKSTARAMVGISTFHQGGNRFFLISRI